MRRNLRNMITATLCLALLFLNVGFAGAVPQDKPKTHFPLITRNFDPGPGSVAGKVVSAQNRNPVINAQVCYRGIICDSTDDQGDYLLTNVPSGWQPVTATAGDFNPANKYIGVKAHTTATLDIALLPVISGVENVVLRIVLTWDPTPTWPPDNWNNDLDANLWMQADINWHIYAPANVDLCNNYPSACLETDFQQGFGPETVAIRKLENAIYYYGVLNYYYGYPGVPPITRSSAEVLIYGEEGVLTNYTVPTSGEGDLWYVFQMAMVTENSVVITPTNCITWYSGDSPPTCP